MKFRKLRPTACASLASLARRAFLACLARITISFIHWTSDADVREAARKLHGHNLGTLPALAPSNPPVSALQISHAPVAQLDRAAVSETVCRTFNSYRGHQFLKRLQVLFQAGHDGPISYRIRLPACTTAERSTAISLTTEARLAFRTILFIERAHDRSA